MNLFFAQDNGGLPWPLIVGMAAIWIFIFIIPMRKEKKKKADMMANLKKGDRLLFNNGLVAKLVESKEKTLIVDSHGSRFEILTDSLLRVIDQKNDG